MKPFTYHAPTTVEEAVALLTEHEQRARVLAGGTDLLVQLRRGLFDLDLVIDVKRIPTLTQIVFDPMEGLTIGAAVSCAVCCECPEVREHYPGLLDAASIIGGAAIQGRATLGGNLCNAAPSADIIPPLIVLDAQAVVVGPGGDRIVPVAAFCTAPGQTVLAKGEMLVALRLPPPAPRTGAAYARFTPRREMDIAVAGAGAWIALSEDRATITDARVALAAVALTPLCVEAVGQALIGQAPTEEAFVEVAQKAQDAARPITDVRGTRSQRRHLVGVLVKRALRTAAARART